LDVGSNIQLTTATAVFLGRDGAFVKAWSSSRGKLWGRLLRRVCEDRRILNHERFIFLAWVSIGFSGRANLEKLSAFGLLNRSAYVELDTLQVSPQNAKIWKTRLELIECAR
jgi:hypothetical protein